MQYFYHEFNANIKCFVGIKSKTNDFDLHSLLLHHKLYLNKLWKKITKNTLFKLYKIDFFILFVCCSGEGEARDCGVCHRKLQSVCGEPGQ